jgi:hypothetical protein
MLKTILKPFIWLNRKLDEANARAGASYLKSLEEYEKTVNEHLEIIKRFPTEESRKRHTKNLERGVIKTFKSLGLKVKSVEF